MQVLASELPRPTLADLYAEEDARDAALSPSGRYLAVAMRGESTDIVLVVDLQTSKQTAPASVSREEIGTHFDLRITNIYWKSDDRLLFRVRVRPKPGSSPKELGENFGRIGDRLFAINRDGSQSLRLLKDSGNIAVWGALDLGEIGSILPNDPQHILMMIRGLIGPTIMRVDITTGKGEIVEFPTKYLTGWWMDLDGNPVVRVERSFGTQRFYRRQADGKWKEFHRTRVREMLERPDYSPVGASDQAGKYYVLARPPGHDRIGVYLYDLATEDFGQPLAENPQYDLYSAGVSRDGKRLLRNCYIAHVSVCEFADAAADAQMRTLRRHFQESASVYVMDAAEDGKTILMFVEGPSLPPSYYYYRVDQNKLELVGLERNSLDEKSLPVAAPVRWKSRDGRELGGYLTRPAGAENAKRLPLIVYPHGGPELRDRMTFDRWVQFLAARGYAVFQPNYRGSDGFGHEFASSGYGEWGGAMQDDITDGLKSLVDQDIVDPERVCIIGASYGGYAALAGATLTPQLYKCAVSIAGVSDLNAFVRWYKGKYGRGSAGADYWERAIGDPGRDKQRLHAVSPVNLAAAIKADVLLVHGIEDDVVPIAQSKAMQKALDRTGHKTTLIELENEGHSFWTEPDEMRTLQAIDVFLWRNLGSGFGVTNPPEDHSHAN